MSLYSKKKFWENVFLLKCVQNGKFIAQKIWKPEGNSKILMTATNTYDSSCYPEKTSDVYLQNWFLLRKFFFLHNLRKRLKATFCKIVEPKSVSKTANILRKKYESKKVSPKFWRRQQKLVNLSVTRKKRQRSIFT